jgi:hypothetical protein
MNRMIRHAAMLSTAALMAVGTGGFAGAQSKNYSDDDCMKNPALCAPAEMRKSDDMDQVTPRKRRIQQAEEAMSDQPLAATTRSEWKFDPKKHRRSRHRDDEFRFRFGAFWYPVPYWLGPAYTYGLVINDRLGCGEGRAIVRDRGFYRVRIVECRGRIYTYLGRRHGDTFRVLLNSRNGRIVDLDPV